MLGRVLSAHSNLFVVQVPALRDAASHGSNAAPVGLTCSVKGLLKKSGQSILAGDFVEVQAIDWAVGTGRINAVVPRKNELPRPRVANVDQVLVLHPLTVDDTESLDRLLSLVALSGLPVAVALSKSDLLPEQHPRKPDWLTLYGCTLQYNVWATSIHQSYSLALLKTLLAGKTTVLAGISGAGKSSLLNALNPRLAQRVGEVSQKQGRGQHTTRHVSLLPLGDAMDGLVADTPGFSLLRFDTVLPEALRQGFPELRDLTCQFTDCLHRPYEQGCALLGPPQMAPSRYAHYLAILEECLAYREWTKTTSQKETPATKSLAKKGGQQQHIVRLEGRHREASRRQHHQHAWQALTTETEDDTPDTEPW
jgi:ribosome biogenesis GTPase